ncbi:hypothetical protein FISHEDRAFT_30828, partial [Fistulina hepatica ATCC 64428]
MKKLPFPKGKHFQTTHTFQIVHTDVFSPITPASLEVVYNQFKSDIKDYFNAEVGEFNLSPDFVDFLQSDNGGEYISDSFHDQL